MRNEKHKRQIWKYYIPASLGLILSCWIWAGGEECDCLPRFPVENLSLGQIEKTLLLDKIAQGDFQTAETLLSRSADPNSPFGSQLLILLEKQLRDQRRWQKQSMKYCQDLFEKIESLHASAAEEPPSRPDEILAVILQARELACGQEPNIPDIDSFVSALTDQVQRKIRNWQSRGEYEKAWRYGLRVLINMSPDDPELKERKKELLEEVSIESDLTPNLCPDQPDPYGKVRAEVLYRALLFLGENYVSPVNFSSLIESAVQYAEHVGRVLASGRPDFLYTADPNDLRIWNEETAKMAQEFAAKKEPEFNAGPCIQWLQRIFELNKRTLHLPEGFLVYGLSESLLSELDPYTEIIWPSQSDEFDKQMTGEFAGVGVRITLDDKKLKVIEVVPGSPAAETGKLRPDDWIKAIDGNPTTSLSLTCAVRQISGPVGSQVMLTIVRDGQELEIPITRRKIVLPSLHGTAPKLTQPVKKNGDLSAYRIDRDPRIGYVWISGFKPDTAESLRAVLERLQDQCLIGLLLDLRSNTGGILDSAASIADLFLTEGLIVKSQNRKGFRLEFDAKPDQVLKDVPIVILVDGSSASGAEIVAGALTEPGKARAVLVGSRTYGKGSVQEVEPLAADGSRIKYTRAFYTLSGDRQVPNRYQLSSEGRKDWGLRPNVEVELNDRQISELQKSRVQLQKFFADNADSQPRPLTEKELGLVDSLVGSDPQLATGLTVLKAKILAAGISLQNQQDPNDIAAP